MLVESYISDSVFFLDDDNRKPAPPFKMTVRLFHLLCFDVLLMSFRVFLILIINRVDTFDSGPAQFSHFDGTNADIKAAPWEKAQAESSVASPKCSYELPAADSNSDISEDDRNRLVGQESENRRSGKVALRENRSSMGKFGRTRSRRPMNIKLVRAVPRGWCSALKKFFLGFTEPDPRPKHIKFRTPGVRQLRSSPYRCGYRRPRVGHQTGGISGKPDNPGSSQLERHEVVGRESACVSLDGEKIPNVSSPERVAVWVDD